MGVTSIVGTEIWVAMPTAWEQTLSAYRVSKLEAGLQRVQMAHLNDWLIPSCGAGELKIDVAGRDRVVA